MTEYKSGPSQMETTQNISPIYPRKGNCVLHPTDEKDSSLSRRPGHVIALTANQTHEELIHANHNVRLEYIMKDTRNVVFRVWPMMFLQQIDRQSDYPLPNH